MAIFGKDVYRMSDRNSIEGNRRSEIENGDVPAIVKAARWIFILLGAIWLVFSVSSILRIAEASANVPAAVLWMVALLMLVNALLMFWLGWGIGRGNRLYFYFGLILLAGNIFLTFTDQFGTLDFVVLLLYVVLLVLLIVGHSKFLEN